MSAAALSLVPEPEDDPTFGVDFSAEEFDFTPMIAARPGASERFLAAHERARKVAGKALQPRTLDSYIYHWRQFVAWCRLMGVSPLPASGLEVGAHLNSLAAGALDDEEDLEVDDDGEVRREPLAAATISLRLAAINKAHVLCGSPAPGSDPYCAMVLRALRSGLGTIPASRDPLTLDLLRMTLERLDLPFEVLRDHALVLCAAHPATGPSDLARLDWARLVLRSNAAVLTLGSGTRDPRLTRRVTLPATGDPRTCPVAALVALGAVTGHVGPVFRRSRLAATGLSDVGAAKIVRRACTAAGLVLPPGLIRLRPADLAVVADALGRPTLLDVRDRSLLLSGFVSAVRRSNLADFRWNDFEPRGGGLVVRLRRSKTDRRGRGLYVFLPAGQQELTCPVRAWTAWRTAVAEALGDDPMEVAGDHPVYVRLGPHGGRLPEDPAQLIGLDDETVNSVVKRRVAAAGLVGNYGAHSLRAGFVTTLWEAGVGLEKIAEQTHHRSLDVLRAYVRRLDLTRDSPADDLGI